jgi:dTDP-4-dehydrorhamnose reductase
MTRVLVTGGAGLLGRALLRARPAGVDALATWRRTPVSGADAVQVELSDSGAVDRLLRRFTPDVVIHTAYGTAEPERDIVRATGILLTACVEHRARLIHLSSDALLDGERAPYDEAAAPAPVHEYGRWKAAAEGLVRTKMPGAAIIRTSLLTSFAPLDIRSRWVADSLRGRSPVTLFVDELRSPIHPFDLAAQLWELAGLDEADARGVWNLAGPESLSRYALGLLVAAHEQLDASLIVPALSGASGTRRPRDLRLLTSRADRQLQTRPRPVSTLAVPPPGC